MLSEQTANKRLEAIKKLVTAYGYTEAEAIREFNGRVNYYARGYDGYDIDTATQYAAEDTLDDGEVESLDENSTAYSGYFS